MRPAAVNTLLRGVLLGLLVAGISVGVLAMHQIPHAVSVVQQEDCGHGVPAQGGHEPDDPLTHMCAGLIVVIAGIGALALIAHLRRELVTLRPALLLWLRRLSGRAPPLRLTLAELCVLRL